MTAKKPKLKFAGNLADIDSDGELTIEHMKKKGGTVMPKPKGHKENCQCAVCKAQRKGKTPKQKAFVIGGRKHPKPHAAQKAKALKFGYGATSGAVEYHKAYSYVNKKTGKVVHVAAHTERR